MPKNLYPLLLLLSLAGLALSGTGVAQEDEPAGQAGDVEPPAAEETAAASDDEEATAEEDEEVDDSDLDEQTYENDDDGFIPTEEIPADEPIPFPSNI
jgi:hypothetical protein